MTGSSKSDGRPPSPWLTVIVPVYNEQGTVDALLGRLRDGPYPDKEVIVVDDGSRDATGRLLERWSLVPGFRVLRHPENRGKGAAVRTGLAEARGEITVIQDADLEYDPADLPRLIEVLRRGDGEVVYGSRYLRPEQALPWSKFRLAVTVINVLVRLLYGQRLTDEATCYKAIRTRLLRELRLTASRFELCAEVTAKLCRLGVRIREEPISYRPRTPAQGKKIGWRDAWPTLWTLIKWRFLPFRRTAAAPSSTGISERVSGPPRPSGSRPFLIAPPDGAAPADPIPTPVPAVVLACAGAAGPGRAGS